MAGSQRQRIPFGTLKKKLGLTVVISKDENGRRYRLDGKSASA